jgi:anti-anti-sigma regulatory factor
VTALINPPELQELQVSVRTDKSHCTVQFSGPLVASSIQVVQGIVDELGALRCECVVVDLSAVTSWDSVGQNVISGEAHLVASTFRHRRAVR